MFYNKIMNTLLRKIRAAIRFAKYIKRGGKINVSISQLSENEQLKGKVCVVTGGAKGLGAMITKRFLSAGAEVIAIGSNQEHLNAFSKEMNNAKLRTYQWDLTDIANIDERLLELSQLTPLQTIDVWVNNAGYLVHDDGTEQQFDKTFALNVKALYYIGQAVCDKMVELNVQGKMINISSINSIQAVLSPYYISKASVNSITKALAKKYILNGVNVNGIAPGYIPSGINYTNIYKNAYREQSYDKRYVLLEEVAELALFLVSGRANSIVGQTIFVDGGDTL